MKPSAGDPSGSAAANAAMGEMTAAATSPRHAAIELLARYRAVFAAAWAGRHEMAGPQRLADEAAFLPAALSLQETPVHPAPRRTMWLLMALFTVAVAWSIAGQVDIVAVANGRVVVSERTKLIQPLQAAVVKVIHVRDGSRVEAGQLLVELDPTDANADQASVSEQQRAAGDEASRTRALLTAIRSGISPSPLTGEGRGGGGLASSATTTTAHLRAEWQDITTKLARHDAELTRRQAELATFREHLTKLQTTLPLASQRETDFKSLTDQGFVSSHAGQDRTRERIELERDLATQQARIKEAEAALAESRNTRAAYLAETQRQLNDRLAQAQLKAAQLKQEGSKTEQRERLTRLTAPVAGTVQQLAVHSPGGVVTPAQALMVIVPNDAEVTAEVAIDNKDIGFVREGQAAEVKLETFNFTRYGTVPATVRWVSADAVPDEKRGAVFMATLVLQRGAVDVDGKAVRVVPGMNLSAEVKVGRRRVIEFLLSPVRQVVGESGRER